MLRFLKPERQDGYLPLEHYAAIGDGRSVALVGADGAIDWWCAPKMDSPPLFNRLHDPDGGCFSVMPDGPFTIERSYRADSNVLETIFITETGRARITESLNSGVSGRLPWCELARRIEAIEGEVRFRILVKPARACTYRTLHNRKVIHFTSADQAMAFCWGEDVEVVEDGNELRGVFVSRRKPTCLALLVADQAPLPLPDLAAIDSRIDLSDAEWRRWAEQLTYDGPFKQDLIRCALSLKFLLYSPTGAIAAAATAGLPERIGGDKNYDYRYAWIRDAAYTVKAFLRAGALAEPIAAFGWLIRTISADPGEPKVVYTLQGDRVPEERNIDVPGYRGSRPVRTGNRANDQVQLSCFGDILETAALFVSYGHILDPVTAAFLQQLANRCVAKWRERDSSIWELEDLQHYTFSKIGCWLALTRAVELAEAGHIANDDAQKWEHERHLIRNWIDQHCWSEKKQAYTFHAGTDRLDAALLLTTRFGFEHDDRLLKTRKAIEQELARGPLVYRYSGAEQEEGAFVACSCWLVEAYALLAEPDEAEKRLKLLFDKLGNNFGLLTEEMDVDTGAGLGNMPQGLSHLALLHAIFSIQENRETAS